VSSCCHTEGRVHAKKIRVDHCLSCLHVQVGENDTKGFKVEDDQYKKHENIDPYDIKIPMSDVNERSCDTYNNVTTLLA
jgi:hypothetical protein